MRTGKKGRRIGLLLLILFLAAGAIVYRYADHADNPWWSFWPSTSTVPAAARAPASAGGTAGAPEKPCTEVHVALALCPKK